MKIVLPIVAGAVLASWVVVGGLLGTPFFNLGAGYWGNIVSALALALGIGFGLGHRIAPIAGRSERAACRLAIVAGAAITGATWALPLLARAILDHDPDWRWASTIFALGVIALPGALVASVVGATVRVSDSETRLRIEDGHVSAQRRFALAMVGGIAGVALARAIVLNSASERVYLFPYANGLLLMIAGAVGTGGAGRVLAGAIGAGLLGLILAKPSEIQRREFLVALTDATGDPGAGYYYLTSELTDQDMIKDSKARKKLERERRNVDLEIPILLVMKTLKSLGAATISGDGLRRTLEIYLDQESMEPVLPFLRKIALIKSDGQGNFDIVIRPDPHVEGAKITISNDKGEPQVLLVKRDITLKLTESVTSTSNTDAIEIWPQEKHPGIVNDTTETPVVCENVALFLDACLIGFVVENKTDQVVVKARAQAKIGAEQTAVLQMIDKRLLMKKKAQ